MSNADTGDLHMFDIKRDDSLFFFGWLPFCSCGWAGTPKFGSHTAMAAASHHARIQSGSSDG